MEPYWFFWSDESVGEHFPAGLVLPASPRVRLSVEFGVRSHLLDPDTGPVEHPVDDSMYDVMAFYVAMGLSAM